MVEDNHSSSRSRPSVHWLVTGILGFIFLAALVVFLGGTLLSRTLVDPALYEAALEDSQFYERIYSDLLADPAMAGVAEDILGDLAFDPSLTSDNPDFRAVTRHRVLPAADIRATAKRGIKSISGYLGGESNNLASGFELYSLEQKSLSERLVDNIMALIATQFAEARAGRPGESPGYDPAQLAGYLDEISAGRIGPVPEGVAAASVGDLSPEEEERLVALLLGPAAEVATDVDQLQIEASLQASQLPDAIILASGVRLRVRANFAAADLLATVQDAENMDAVARLSRVLGQAPSETREALGRIRTTILLFKWAFLPLELFIMALALIGILLVLDDNVVALLRTTGLVLVLGGILLAAGWSLAGPWLREAVDSLFLASDELPAVFERMITDVVSSAVDKSWTDAWQTALIPLALGIFLLVISLLPGLRATVNRWPIPLWRFRRGFITVALLLFVLLPVGWLLIRDRDRGPGLVCNGHAELCERPLNEVTFAASHKTMAVTEDGWLWPGQDGTVTNQLKAGIRGFVIESRYWDDEAFIEGEVQDLPVGVQAAILDSLERVKLSSKDGAYLCHLMCGLGATFLSDTLSEMRAFLDNQPNEVIVLIIEDGISLEDTAAAFTASGLERLVYTHSQGQAWPTLGQMIEQNKRVLVLAENGGPPPGYYHHAGDYLAETGELVDSSCKVNGGEGDKPFLLLNHWQSGAVPSRVEASIINKFDDLLARAQACNTELGQAPNLVAVDFHLTGDVLAVVDMLNGIRGTIEGQ